MSMENLKRLYAYIRQTPSLQSQLENLSDHADFVQRMIQLGKENGYPFAAEDLEAAIASTKLSDMDVVTDDQLEKVAGGARLSTLRQGVSGGSETECSSDSRWLDPFCT